MIYYKIDVLTELKRKGLSTYQLRKEKLLSEGAIQNLRNGEPISFSNLGSLCKLLELQPGDIIGYKE